MLYNLLSQMNGLDHYARKIYGNKLKKNTTLQQPHHIFTHYQNSSTKEQFFLKTIDLPAHLRISEGIAERFATKYGSIITPLQITPLDRNFQNCTYLLRAPQNSIFLTTYLQIKKDCSQCIEFSFFISFLEFVMMAWKLLEQNQLPAFGIGQIGINDAKQFTLCDPELYFQRQKGQHLGLPFGEWIMTLMKEFIGLPLDRQLHEQVQIQRFGQNLKMIKPLINYLLSGSITPQILQTTLVSIANGYHEESTTVTSSNSDINELGVQKSLQSGLPQKKKNPFFKNRFGRLIIAFIVVTVLVAIGYFCFQFFNRKIICSEGTFLSDSNSCLSCAEGCLRCATSQPNQCMKCVVNMFLVLEEEEDKEGFCLKECRGKLIALGVCIRDKPRPSLNRKDDEIPNIQFRMRHTQSPE